MSLGALAASSCRNYSQFLYAHGICNRRVFSSSPSLLSQPNYYQILGVRSDATKKEIQDAFREQSRRHHPDSPHRTDDSENTYKSITAAYKVLNMEETRKDYDSKLRKLLKKHQPASSSSSSSKASTSAAGSARHRFSHSAEDRSTKSHRQKPQWNYDRMKSKEPSSTNSQASSSPASFAELEANEKRGVGQPPSLKETQKRRRRLELESRNQSLEVFPDGDDPCKGYGIWILTPGTRHFTAFEEHPKEVWEPIYQRALRQIKERFNESHLAFPDGNDPCKGLGIWRSVETAITFSRFRFEPFDGVPEKAYRQKSEAALRILNTQYRKALESRDISKYLFPDNNDPCKGYGVWLTLNTDTGAVNAFKFNEVSEAVWIPRYRRASKCFNALPNAERTLRVESARDYTRALNGIFRAKHTVSRLLSWLMGKK